MGAFCAEYPETQEKVYHSPEVKPVNPAVLFCHSCSVRRCSITTTFCRCLLCLHFVPPTGQPIISANVSLCTELFSSP